MNCPHEGRRTRPAIGEVRYRVVDPALLEDVPDDNVAKTQTWGHVPHQAAEDAAGKECC
jgi:hypothetical protein